MAILNPEVTGASIVKQIFLSPSILKRDFSSFVVLVYNSGALRRISVHSRQSPLEAGLGTPKAGRPSLRACGDGPRGPPRIYPRDAVPVAPGHPERDAPFLGLSRPPRATPPSLPGPQLSRWAPSRSPPGAASSSRPRLPRGGHPGMGAGAVPARRAVGASQTRSLPAPARPDPSSRIRAHVAGPGGQSPTRPGRFPNSAGTPGPGPAGLGRQGPAREPGLPRGLRIAGCARPSGSPRGALGLRATRRPRPASPATSRRRPSADRGTAASPTPRRRDAAEAAAPRPVRAQRPPRPRRAQAAAEGKREGGRRPPGPAPSPACRPPPGRRRCPRLRTRP